MRDMNLRDMKMRHHVAGVENARHESAAPTCKGGNFHPCKLVPQIHVSHFQSPHDMRITRSCADRHQSAARRRRRRLWDVSYSTFGVQKDDLYTGRRRVERCRRGLRLRRCGRSSRISLLLVRSLKCTQLFSYLISNYLISMFIDISYSCARPPTALPSVVGPSQDHLQW